MLRQNNLQDICEARCSLKEFGGFVRHSPLALHTEKYIEAYTLTIFGSEHAFRESANTVEMDKIEIAQVRDQYLVGHLPSLDNQPGQDIRLLPL